MSAPQLQPVPTMAQPQTLSGWLLEAEARVRFAIGHRMDLDRSHLRRWINAAYIQLCSTTNAEGLESTLAITYNDQFDSVIFSQGIYIPRELSGPTGPLRKMDLSAWRHQVVATGEPCRWLAQKLERNAWQISVWPSPASLVSYNLDFRVQPLQLVNDDDAPILGEEWDEVLIQLATALAHKDLREFESFAQAYNTYVGMVRDKIDTRAENREDMIGSMDVIRSERDL